MRLLLCVLLPTRLAIWWTHLTRKERNPSSNKRASFILFRLDALGDLVLTTPLFRELKRSYPQARVSVVVPEAYKSILDNNPFIDELLLVPSIRNSSWLKPAHHLLATLLFYWRTLRGRKFDVAICPRWDTDEHLATLLCVLTRAELRVGYSEHTTAGKRRFNRGFDRAFDICLAPGPLRHELERNLAMVDALGGTVSDKSTEIDLTPADRSYADRVLKNVSPDSVLIALGIGAQSAGRRWPLERYSAVIDGLCRQYPVHIVITCAPSEHELAIHLAKTLPDAVTISDSSEIRETCALLARCDLFIGNDTGAAHLAAAMGCPTLVISRHPESGDPKHPNGPARFAPWSECARVLQPAHGLDTCDTRCTQPGPHCIEQTSVPEVVAAAHTMLMQSSRVRDKLKASLAF
jgi:ADP-heptose:LPS heptosyltransferase